MYQPAPALPADKPGRPIPVTAAVVIMGILALLSLVSASFSVASISGTESEFRRLARRENLASDEIEAALGALKFGFICNAVVMVLFAVLLAFLAWGLAKGSQAARVVTWVVCGLGILCACCTGTGSIGSFSSAGPGSVDSDQVTGNLMVQALPDWAGGILLGSSGLSVLGYIATAILLAVPAANAFFRGARSAGAWQPPSYPQNPPNYPPPSAHPSHPAPPANPPQPPPPPPPPSTL